jgi:hypothetical protein
MGHDVPVPVASQPTTDPLDIVALDTERYVATRGWDQGPRLFALVPTAELVIREPHLADHLDVADRAPGALTAVEQEDLPDTASLETMLSRIAWPDTVAGCALAVERLVLPPGADEHLPDDPEEATQRLARHPGRHDIRLVVAVTRDGASRCLIRQREHDSDDAVARGERLAPGLIDAMLATLAD